MYVQHFGMARRSSNRLNRETAQHKNQEEEAGQANKIK